MSELNSLAFSKSNIDPLINAYYRVGQQVYKSKLLALYEATRSGLHPTWHFGDEIFSQIKWDQGHVTDILPYYEKRAKQLRDKYDYVILSYSGGADSRTMLEAFLKQKIKPDEVFVTWPIKATEGKYTVSTDTSTGANILSEWDLVIKDDLNFLKKYHPTIKITVEDFSADMCDDKAELTDEDWHTMNDHLNPNVFRKFTIISENERRMLDLGKKTAIISGIDKPQVLYKDGHLYLYFLDKLANTKSSDHLSDRVSEMFYWCPEFPELIHAQARLVYYFFYNNPQYLQLINWDTRTTDPIRKKNELNVFMKQIVYPNWNMRRFQAHKPTSMVWQETDTWFFTNFTHTKYYESYISGLKNLMNSVDKKYHQPTDRNRFEGWIGFTSPFYDLGTINTKKTTKSTTYSG